MNQLYLNNYELWKQFKDGDQRASQLIYQIYRKKLINFGNQITQNTELVKDTWQDLFLKLLIRKGTLADVDNIEPYLKSSLRHDLVRKVVASQKQLVLNEYLEDDYLTECHRSFHSHDSEEREVTFVRLD
jgi:DNA-directed RNA polymerase specialized sigma24 family protein